MAGLVPAISIRKALACQPKRDARVKPAHDNLAARCSTHKEIPRWNHWKAPSDDAQIVAAKRRFCWSSRVS